VNLQLLKLCIFMSFSTVQIYDHSCIHLYTECSYWQRWRQGQRLVKN